MGCKVGANFLYMLLFTRMVQTFIFFCKTQKQILEHRVKNAKQLALFHATNVDGDLCCQASKRTKKYDLKLHKTVS